jgi:hypothetical protein
VLLAFALLVWLLSMPSMAAEKLDIAPFKAKFALYYKWLHLGYGEYRFSDLGNHEYLFDFDSQMRFLLFTDKRQVSTRFRVKGGRLLPIVYEHHRQGTGENYDEKIRFLPKQQLILAEFRNKSMQEPYNRSIIDGLLVQLQLMLDVKAGRKPLDYQIFESFGVMDRAFIYQGSAVAELQQGDTDCTKVAVEREQKAFRTEICFAKSMAYMPVELVHFSEGKKQFSAKLVEFTALD